MCRGTRASRMPRCGSGQYSMLPADTYRSNESVRKGSSSASPCAAAACWPALIVVLLHPRC